MRTDYCVSAHILIDRNESAEKLSAAIFVYVKSVPFHEIHNSETRKAYKIFLTIFIMISMPLNPCSEQRVLIV